MEIIRLIIRLIGSGVEPGEVFFFFLFCWRGGGISIGSKVPVFSHCIDVQQRQLWSFSFRLALYFGVSGHFQ